MNEVVYKYVIFFAKSNIREFKASSSKQTVESNPVIYNLKCHSTKKKQQQPFLLSVQFVLFEKEKEISHIILTPKFNLRKFTLYRSHTTYTAIAPSGVSEFTYTQKNDARGRCCFCYGVHRFLESKCAWGLDQTHNCLWWKKNDSTLLSYNDNMHFSNRVLINCKFFFVI